MGRITVYEEPVFTAWNTTQYRFFGNPVDYPDEPILTTQTIKSAFELPFPATLRPGINLITGRSWSAAGTIARVDVSFNYGDTYTRHAEAGRKRSPSLGRMADSMGGTTRQLYPESSCRGQPRQHPTPDRSVQQPRLSVLRHRRSPGHRCLNDLPAIIRSLSPYLTRQTANAVTMDTACVAGPPRRLACTRGR